METGNSFNFTGLYRGLLCSPFTQHDFVPQELQLEVLLWNINGNTSRGMAEARKMLVEEVIKNIDSDIVLLQEVTARETIRRAQQKSLPQRSYDYRCSKYRLRGRIFEAAIMYDTYKFECIEINIIELIGRKDLSGLPPSKRELRGGLTRDQEYYSDRTCALRLRSRRDGTEFVVVSFHNSRRDTIPNTLGFLKLIELIYEQENVPVIVGGDFNHNLCYPYFIPDYIISDFFIPDYHSSVRRYLRQKIDFFVIRKPHPSTTITCEVEVFEALPLVDPTSSEADTHPLGRPVLRRLAGAGGLSWQQFNRVSNHDPTIGRFTIHSGQ